MFQQHVIFKYEIVIEVNNSLAFLCVCVCVYDSALIIFLTKVHAIKILE